MELFELTLHELLALHRTNEVSSLEIIDSIFERIHQVEDQVKAFISLDEEHARTKARAADNEKWSGKISGMPFALKDIFCTRGLKTTCGSKMLANFVPTYDSTAGARLNEAGGVLVGKLNMDEFAMGSSTEQSAFHATHNPWDLTRVPGGSSGGSAAAVAAGEVPFALGTDTGGSIRQPAAFCGVVGLRPSNSSGS